MPIALLIPIILGLGLSGCLSSNKEEEMDGGDSPPPKDPPKKDGGTDALNLPCREKPNNQNKDRFLAERSYITSKFSGPFWSANDPVHERDVFVHVQEDLGMDDPEGLSRRLWHQATQCAPAILKKLGITDANPMPSRELNFFVKADEEIKFAGGAKLAGGEIQFKPSSLSYAVPFDNINQCISPIMAHELTHLALGTGVFQNLLLNQPDNSVLEEGLASYIENQVTASANASQLLGELSLDLPLLADQSEKNKECFYSAIQNQEDPCHDDPIGCCLESIFGPPTQLGIGLNGMQIGIYTTFSQIPGETRGFLSIFFNLDGNTVPDALFLDVYQDQNVCSSSEYLSPSVAQTACFVHDQPLPVNAFERGSLFFLQNLFDPSRPNVSGKLSCGQNGFSSVSYLTLEDGRQFQMNTSSENSYGISIFHENYLTEDTYQTGACFWDAIDKSFPNNFLKITRSSYDTGLNHPGGAINVFSLLSVDQTDNKEYIQALNDDFASHNIPVDIFSDQLLQPLCP